MIKALEETKLPVTSVDAPSSWDIESGPPQSGLGSKFNPEFLVSLSAPKPLVHHFKGRHFIGGRYVFLPASSSVGPKLTNCSFIPPSIAKKYDFEIPSYKGADQFLEVAVGNAEKL